MSDVFHSARLTFDRAKYHIRDFNSVVAEFIRSHPWAEFIDRESRPGSDIHKVRFERQPPETLPCVLFDAANNLRAVLDQSGYAAAIAGGKVGPTKCNFPFGDSLAEIETHIARRKAGRDLPPEILTQFVNCKPYNGGNTDLWALNKLCNTKKHCQLTAIIINEPHINFSANVPEGTPIGRFVAPDGTTKGWDSEKQEMTLLTVPAGLDPNIRGHIAFDVAIEGVQPLAGQSAIRVLDRMSSIVESILMSTEVECRRQGYV